MADQIVQTIVEWVSAFPPVGIYLFFFAIAYLENILPPVPGDVLLAFGGYLAAEGVIGLGPVWILTVIASVLGFMNMYWMGFKLGGSIDSQRDEHFLLRFINYRYFRKGKVWMYRYGQWVVFANRFLAGTRSVIAVTAGMSKLKINQTILNSFLSSVLWNTILLGMGWFVKDHWELIGEYLSAYGKVILVCIGIAILGRFLWVRNKQNKAPEESEKK